MIVKLALCFLFCSQCCRAFLSGHLMTLTAPSKVLVVGSTGRTGSRVAAELIKSKAQVTCAVRPSSMDKAKEMLPKGADIVAIDLTDTRSISDAMIGCDAVVCALGALETDALNWKAPYQVDGKMTQRVIDAAKDNGSIKHFIMVSSLGTGGIGFPASILNLFWGVLTWKRQSELHLQKSGVPYTIIRPGGMERPKDDYELTHNLRVAPANYLYSGQISRLQIAKLACTILENPACGLGKIVEAVAEETAPKVDAASLLAELPAEPTVIKTDLEWLSQLNPLAWSVLRKSATEPAYSSPNNYEKRKGDFACAACGQVLFKSDNKFESGTGWPSFDSPAVQTAVNLRPELMGRMEVACSRCGSHQGHVFNDGPRKTTGLRYCINGAALRFKPLEESKPE